MTDSTNAVPDDLRNTILQKNCIEGMKELPENSVDLVVADPPYNLSKGADWSWDNEVDLDGFGGDWDKTMENWDDMGLEEYAGFTQSWLSEAKRVLKPTGSIWTFGSYHNIGIVNMVYQMLGVEIINEVIWFKRNAFPNLSGRRFTASHETLLWGHTGGPDNREYTFNYELMKSLPFPEDNINDEEKQVRTVWDIPNNKSSQELEYGKHPTQKPLRVLERLILSASNEGDLCLAPFAGSGSTCVSAKLNDRDYLGFETESEHVELARERLKNAKEKPDQLQNGTSENQGTLNQYD
ncbi:DNA-methyltransferase [Halosegnis rubeus]|jgi:site-specific DNA-methyltransferase (adenine-specific)|nr:site-specific DNA-methyltransferase [Halosegnis rubeus]